MASEIDNMGIGIKPVSIEKPAVTRNVVVPRRHPGRWLAIAILAVLALQIGQAVSTNPNFHWDIYSTYLFSPQVIREIDGLVAKGIITDVSQVGGYPEYRGQPYQDSDSDGMPDDWESRHGLAPSDASDAGGDLNGDGYTNIEDFLNSLDPQAPKQEWPAPKTYKDLFKGVES